MMKNSGNIHHIVKKSTPAPVNRWQMKGVV